MRVNYDIHLFPAHLAALLTGRFDTPFHDVVLFGKSYGYGAALGTRASVAEPAAVLAGPLLTIDFTSQGGGLYVRNYPGSIDPELVPQWPGYPVTLEPRPILGGEPAKVRRQMLRDWHQRLATERASQAAGQQPHAGPVRRMRFERSQTLGALASAAMLAALAIALTPGRPMAS